MTLQELLKKAEQKAIEHNKEYTAVKRLLLYVLNCESAELILKLSDKVNSDVIKTFEMYVDQYIFDNIPVQHIIGFEYFFGHKFIVSSDVLIPRRETEELVEQILYLYDDLFDGKEVSLLDLGTGSGCLAVTLAKEEPMIKATAIDISKEALDIAAQNAKNLEVDVEFFVSNMFREVTSKYDIIVSNPPYIPKEEYVESLVKDNEPHVALFGGEDGLDFYRDIIKNAHKYVKERYIIGFEHAYDKTKELRAIIDEHFNDVLVIHKKDLQEQDRMTFIIKK